MSDQEVSVLLGVGEVDLPTFEDFTSGRIKSLGWGVLEWCSKYLAQPDGENKGQRWVFTNEQALVILRWYAVDEHGDFYFSSRGVLERPKGWGKSPLLAAMCCAELLGPVRFSHWDENGEPVGKPVASPLIQIAAINNDQADNTYSLVMEMLLDGEAYQEYGFTEQTVLLSRVRTPHGGMIKKVTASFRGREGQRVTFVVCDETHLWVPAEKGPELYAVLKRNAKKLRNRIFETTNAPVPGEGSVAESSYNATTQLISEADGDWRKCPVLLDSKQVQIDDIYNTEDALTALRYVYGDATQERGGWIDVKVWLEDIRDPSTPENEARRFYFNEKVNRRSNWLEAKRWAACHDQTLELLPEDKFTLGFSGAIRNGAAGLVAYRITDGALFVVGLWEKTDDCPDDWEVPFSDVDYRIRKMLARDQGLKLVANPEHWQEIVGRWYADFEDKVEEFWLTKNKAKAANAVEQFETAVYSKRIKWKDPSLQRHILNCHVTELPMTIDTGASQAKLIRKETPHSKRYITLAQAALLAVEAGVLAISEGALNEEEEYYMYSY